MSEVRYTVIIGEYCGCYCTNWCKEGAKLYHREDGPAREFKDGYKEYWLKGKQYSKKDYDEKIASMRALAEAAKDNLPKSIVIDGVEYVRKQKV